MTVQECYEDTPSKDHLACHSQDIGTNHHSLDLFVGKTNQKGETTKDTQPKGLSPTAYPFFGWTYTKESNVLYWAPSTKISPYKGANTGH